MRSLTLRLLPLLIVLPFGVACSAGTASNATPVSRIVSPLDAIVVPPRLNDAQRAEIVREGMAAPADAVWVDVLMRDSAVVEAVRAAQATK
ncbi:MAG: hypothetical protein ACRYGR_09910 [Janthinobacterium lividum]